MTTRKRSKDDEESFDDEPVAKRIAAAAAMDPDPARPSSFEDQAHWNRMFFELMVRAFEQSGKDSLSIVPAMPSCLHPLASKAVFSLLSVLLLSHFLPHPQLYRANYGNVNVKSTDEKYAELYRWIVQLRKDYKTRERNPEESPITADQIKTLESVRFAFTTRGEEHWQKNYEKLQEYKKEHGHVLVPRQCEIPGLGDWVCLVCGVLVKAFLYRSLSLKHRYSFFLVSNKYTGHQSTPAVSRVCPGQANSSH
jgi:hypothetical protein